MTALLEAMAGLRAGWQLETLIAALSRVTIIVLLCTVLARTLRRQHIAQHALWAVAFVLAFGAPLTATGIPAFHLSLVLPAPTRDAYGASSWIFLAWSAVTGTLLLRVAVGHRRLSRVVRTAAKCEDPRIVQIANEAAASMQVKQLPAICLSSHFALPVSFGILRPAIVLPSDATTWTSVRLQMVLRHELAHVRRNDSLWQLLARFACALHWFNPLVWHAARRFRITAELACDRCVVSSRTEAIAYVGELIALAEQLTPRASALEYAMPFVESGALEQRVAALLSRANHHRPSTAIRTVAAVVCLGVFTLATLFVRPGSDRCTTVNNDAAIAR